MNDAPRDPFVATNELTKKAIKDGVKLRQVTWDLTRETRLLSDAIHALTTSVRDLTAEVRALRIDVAPSPTEITRGASAAESTTEQ